MVEDLNRAARANGKVVFHIIVQLPHDVSPEQRAEVLSEWCEDAFGARNLPYIWAVHTPDADGDQRNFHGHVAVSFRPMVRVAPFTWDAGRELKAELDNPEAFRVLRERFAETMTEVCDRAGKNRTYTALSYAERGLKLKPTVHIGPHKTRLVRQGKYVAAHARNARTIQRNEAMIRLERLKQRRKVLDERLERANGIGARSVNSTRRAGRPVAPANVRSLSAATAAQRAGGPSPERANSVMVVQRSAVPAPVPMSIIKPVRRPTVAQAPAPTLGTINPLRLTDRAHSVMDVVRLPRPLPAVGSTVPRSTLATVGARRTVDIAAGPVLHHSVSAARDANSVARTPSTPVTSVPVASRQPSISAERLDPVRGTLRAADARPATVINPVRPRTKQPTAGPGRQLDSVRQRAGLLRLAERALTSLAPVRRRASFAAAHPTANPVITPPGFAARPTTPQSNPALLDAWDVESHRRRIARAKAKLRAAEQRRAAEAEASKAFTPAPLAAPAAPVRRRPARKAHPESSGWSGDVVSFDAVPAADQITTFAEVATFENVGTLGPVAEPRAPGQPRVAEPDGFGGTRTAPPAVFRPMHIDVRLAAFSPKTGAPSRSLIALLHHTGHHPNTLAFAQDGRLMALPGTPKAIEPLVHMWRHNEEVEALVVSVVTASRAAGRPVWPNHLAARIRALDPPGTSDRSSQRDWSDGITR